MKRPAAVVAAAVIAFVLGGLGILGSAMTIPVLLLDPEKGTKDIAQRPLLEAGWFLTYTKVSIVLGIFVAIGLIAVGVGLVRLRPWARRAMMAWAAYAIANCIFGTAAMFVAYKPALDRVAAEADPIMGKALVIAFWVSVVISGFMSLVLPSVVLILMLVRSSSEAFREPAPAEDPGTAP